MRRVFVTGGHGFLGTRLCAALQAGGDEVVAPEQHELDLAGPTSFERFPGPFDAVVHAGAFVPAGAPSPDDLLQASHVGAEGTHRVLEFARRAGARRVVYVSSADVYGPSPALPVTEGAPLGPTGPAAPYALGKLWGEQVAKVHADAFGLGVVSLRFTILYGSTMRKRGVLATFWARAAAGETLEVRAPQASNDYLHVDDAVRAICLALAHARPAPVYNVGGGREITLLELAQTICRVRGVPEHRIVVGSDPGRRFWLDSSLASDHLGLRGVLSLEAGLRSMVES